MLSRHAGLWCQVNQVYSQVIQLCRHACRSWGAVRSSIYATLQSCHDASSPSCRHVTMACSLALQAGGQVMQACSSNSDLMSRHTGLISSCRFDVISCGHAVLIQARFRIIYAYSFVTQLFWHSWCHHQTNLQSSRRRCQAHGEIYAIHVYPSSPKTHYSKRKSTHMFFPCILKSQLKCLHTSRGCSFYMQIV